MTKICKLCGKEFKPRDKSYRSNGKLYTYPDMQHFKLKVYCGNACSTKINSKKKNYKRNIMGTRLGTPHRDNSSPTRRAYINTWLHFKKKFGLKLTDVPRDVARAKFAIYLIKQKAKGKDVPCLS